jgi:UDP-sulfoquinovose synthase
MRILILGMDGYLGWPLALHLTKRGHTVGGCDAMLRRQWVEKLGGHSAIPIADVMDRYYAFKEHYGYWWFKKGNLYNWKFVQRLLDDFKPDTIVHLAEMPSAAYSMIDVKHALYTHTNNVGGTLNLLFAMRDICPDAHLVKLGTMGEYGTPNTVIPEGFFEIEYRGRKDTLPFPRQPGSFYHLTKVHDSHNIAFVCKTWGLRSTDIMQGVVFGTQIDGMNGDERMRTRLDFDECFGTLVNRFCCQAVIGFPLTPYGSGEQTRGFLPLRDSMQCLTLAIENPPEAGEYRVFNQFQETFSAIKLAEMVQVEGEKLGLPVTIRHMENPRIEVEKHYYDPDCNHLVDLGYVPSIEVSQEISIMLQDLMGYRERIEAKKDMLRPQFRWDGRHRESEWLTTM